MASRLPVLLASALLSLATLPLNAQVGPIGRGGVVGGVGQGGVVGGTTTKPGITLGSPATSASPANVTPLVPIVSPKTFKPLPEDPIERADFASTVKPIKKTVTSAMAMMVVKTPDGEIGMTSDVIATVSRPDTSKQFAASIIKKQAAVGKQMQTSFDEAVRAVQLRYPKLEPAQIDFSFGEKYTPHEGGSAGTCFAVMMLSEIEGFDIDPKCAITGDITVDWKVRKIGGLPAKIRGAAADKCLYAGAPLENRSDIADMALFYGDQTLRDIQVFSLESLQDAQALMRKDRSPQLAEAIKEFSELKPKLATGRSAYAVPAVRKVLENIVALAPNHESAKMMLEMADGKFPRTVSLSFALDEFELITDPYTEIIIGIQLGVNPINRSTVSQAMTQSALKSLNQLAPVAPTELQPLLADVRKIINASESVAAGAARPDSLEPHVKSFLTHADALDNNKAFREKLIRGN